MLVVVELVDPLPIVYVDVVLTTMSVLAVGQVLKK